MSGLASSALASARSLMALQLGSRLLTFALNQALPRLASPRAFGTAAIHFELLSSTMLFIAREGVRNALLRTEAVSEEEKAEAKSMAKARQNVSCIPFIIGVPLAIMAASMYIRMTGPDTISQPGFRTAIAIYAFAAMVELATEPWHNRAMSELNMGARVRAEGLGVAMKTVMTFLVLYYDANIGKREGEFALLAFAAGQFMYASAVYVMYAMSFGWTLALCPQRLQSNAQGLAAYFDMRSLGLSLTMTVQSLVKHVLTEGDKFILSWLSPLQDQGGYAIASNYGALVARIIFQPVEEMFRLYFSKLLSGFTSQDESTGSNKRVPSSDRSVLQQASSTLLKILSVQTSFTLFLLIFGSAYIPIALYILLPPRYLVTSAPDVLKAWIWYVPVLACNGVLEAFLSSVSTKVDLNRQSRWMVLFSVIYVCTALFFYGIGLGDSSLVYANIVNLCARITYCSRFIFGYFTSHNARDLLTWRSILPRTPVVMASLLSYVLILCSDGKLDVTRALTESGGRGVLRKSVFAHVGIGAVLGLTCLAVWWRSSGRYLLSIERSKKE